MEQGPVQPGEIEGDTLPGKALLDFFAVDLNFAHPRFFSGGENLHRVAYIDGAGEQGAGNHGAEAADTEMAVDRQAQRPVAVLGDDAFDLLPDGFHKLRNPVLGDGGNPAQGSLLQKGAGDLLADLLLDDVDPVFLGQIAFVEDNNSPGNLQQLENLQMLVGLGHDPFHDIHDQQDQIDAADAGQHVADESFMAGDVDHPGDLSAGEAKGREPEVDGNSPRFFLFQTVRVGSGQGPDQLGLAVVDVTGGADNDMLVFGLRHFLFGNVFENIF